MYKKALQYAAILAFVLGVIATGLGGWSNMMGSPIIITERHAWNDGLFMMLAAIFLLSLSRVL